MASLLPISRSSGVSTPAVDFGTDTVWNKFLTDPINLLRSFIIATSRAPLPPTYNTTPAAESIPPIALSSGISIPAIGFGTGTVWNKSPTDPINEALVSAIVSALKAGYRHLDCSERYNTASEIGLALSRVEVPRSDLFITTKVEERSAANPGSGLRDQLRAMGTEYVDLYLIHQPFTLDVKTIWRALETLQREGLTRAIGVSNFNKSQLEELYGYAEIKPVVNQVELNPYCIDQELLSFCREKGIVTEAFSGLAPLTNFKGGPLDVVVEEISNRVGKTPAQVLLKWLAQQGFVVLTTSAKEERQKELLDLGFELSGEDVERMRKEGAKEHHRQCWPIQFGEA